MRTLLLGGLRNHIQLWLILPLIIIVITWPTSARLFDADELWLHDRSADIFLRLWDSWHLGQVLAGHAELWYSVDTFHPRGVSLTFQHYNFPHALLHLALRQVMPEDGANNLLFLLILFFNGMSVYVLALHLLKDKWVALFGAAVTAVCINFGSKNMIPDLSCIGTLPLTFYFFHRALFERRSRLAALGGFFAGITAFIGMYTFIFILLGSAIYAAFLLPSRWRQRAFWRLLLVFTAVCAAICALRIYPMFADAETLQEGLAKYDRTLLSNDVLEYFVNSRNPHTAGLLNSVFNVPHGRSFLGHYLGYINLLLLACALLLTKPRYRLLPWLALFVFFALMRQGGYLTFNGVPYQNIVLPARVLRDTFRIPFGQIGFVDYYWFGLVAPLALVSSFGLAALIRGRSAKTRALAALAAILLVSFEHYTPIAGISAPKGATAYVDWFKSQPDDSIKLINLPRARHFGRYALYAQSLTGYPTAYGSVWRSRASTAAYVDRNWLLHEWARNRSGSCFGRAQEYRAALDELLAEGFTHIVLHHWGLKLRQVRHGFARVPVAYNDRLVSIYRTRDMRLACADLPPELAAFDHFLTAHRDLWHPGSSLLSFHPGDRLDDDQLAYLDASVAYTSDWDGLLHLYVDQGEPVFQTAVRSQLNVEEFIEQSQTIYVVHASHNTAVSQMTIPPPLDQYQNCGQRTLDGGWVFEHLLRREFSCALFTSPAPLEARYDNGAHLANFQVELEGEHLDVQLRWGALPEKRHAISVQFFDMAGYKVHNQDFIVKDVALAHHRIDLSALQPSNYVIKVILYDFYAGNSASGDVSATGIEFERELEIATIAWS